MITFLGKGIDRKWVIDPEPNRRGDRRITVAVKDQAGAKASAGFNFKLAGDYRDTTPVHITGVRIPAVINRSPSTAS